MTHAHDYESPRGHEHDQPRVHGGKSRPVEGHVHVHPTREDAPVDPRAEIMALMRYMIDHNAAHAGELSALAGRIREMGDDAACERVARAVEDFESGNRRLAEALALFSEKEAE